MHEIQIRTNGKLDVDIVRNYVEKNPETVRGGGRFIQSLLNDRDKSKLFQEFLAQNLLSSHAWVLGKKPEDE